MEYTGQALPVETNDVRLVSRLKAIHLAFGFRQMRPIHYLIACIYVLGILFAISAAVTNFGFGLIGPSECEAAIIICLTFYLGQKALVYLFLVERTHVVRGGRVRRKDWVYLVGMVCLSLLRQ